MKKTPNSSPKQEFFAEIGCGTEPAMIETHTFPKRKEKSNWGLFRPPHNRRTRWRVESFWIE
jgi:hypothetical protein